MNAFDKNRLWGNLMTKRSNMMKRINRIKGISGLSVLLCFCMLFGWSLAEAMVDGPGKKNPFQRSPQARFISANQKLASGASDEFWSYFDSATNSLVEVAPKRILVGFDPGTPVSARYQSLTGFQRNSSSQYAPLARLGFYVIELPDATSVEDLQNAVSTLKQRQHVKYATLDYVYRYALIPDDERYSDQEHLPQISAPEAWDIQPGQDTPQDVIIAILDSGVDLNHPDLRANLWVNEDEIPGDGIDNDQNGFIDDFQGWNFTYNNNVPDDDYMHGTHVAGLAAAIGNNGLGVVGSGLDLTIMPVKVGSPVGPVLSDILAGIQYAADNGADVINMSLGGPYTLVYDPFIKYAVDNDVAVVASAGNDNRNLDQFPQSPVSNDGDDNWVFGVAAVDSNDIRADFSNYGIQHVDVAAPGDAVLSTLPDFLNFYGRMSGTSMSAPVAAGVVGLVKAYRPDHSYDRLYAAVSEYADNIDAQNPGYIGLLGGGRVNAEQALLNADIAGIVKEEEPNDDFETATPVESDEPVELAIVNEPGDVDFYSIYLEEGQIIRADVFAERLTEDPPSEMNPQMTLYDSEGAEVFFQQDTPGYGIDVRLNNKALIGPLAPQADLEYREYIRIQKTGLHYFKIEDENPFVSGDNYDYYFLVQIVPQHEVPAQNLIPPFSDPTSVIGISLYEESGATFLQSLTVRVETNPNSSGRLELSDLQPITLNKLSGIAVYRDGQGPNEGQFDFSESQTDDQLIVPTEQPRVREAPGTNGHAFEVSFQFYDPAEGLNPSPLTFVPSEEDDLHDFFVVLRTSGDLSHDESFQVTIPPGGLVATNRLTTQQVTFEDQGFGGNSYPEFPQLLFGEAIQFVNFTEVFNTVEQGLDVSSPPVPVIGINAISPAKDNLSLTGVTVTFVAVPPLFQFLNRPNDNLFQKTDLAPLSGDETSGVALYRDGTAGTAGIFEEDRDIFIPLETLNFVNRPNVDGATEYVIDLTPSAEEVSPELLALPVDDEASNGGSDFYIVIRTSDRIRDGDTFRVEVQTETATGVGGVRLSNQSDDFFTRRVIDSTSVPPVFDITARPKPKFFLSDLTGGQLRVPKESKATAIIGINAVDYGANQLDSDGDSFGYFFDTISIDFLDVNADGDFTQSDLRPIVGNVAVDQVYGEYASGVAIYMDDSTPIEDGVDDDGDGLIDEELLNNIDDDYDGLVDEDVGDDDPAGRNGLFDELDDYIPFFRGSVDRVLDPDNPRFPGTGQESPHTGHNFDLRGLTNFAETVYPQSPAISNITGESGFRVSFDMEMYRFREVHPCQGVARTVTVASDVISPGAFARASEIPLVGIRGPQDGRGQLLECQTTGGISAAGQAWHVEGLGMVDTGQLCCAQASAIALLMSYNYVIEVPDDNEGANAGDDFYVVIRTSNTINDGDDFKVRMDTGSITYRNFKTIDINTDTLGGNDIAPGANATKLETGVVLGDVPINIRFNDLTTFQQRVDPLTEPAEPPLPVLGIDLDVASQFPEEQQPGFSDEEITSFFIDFVDETEPREEVESNDGFAAANTFFIGDSVQGELITVADEDYFVFEAPRDGTAMFQVVAENPLILPVQLELFNEQLENLTDTGPVVGEAQTTLPIQLGSKYYVKVTGEAGTGNRVYRLLSWIYDENSNSFKRRGFQVSNDPVLSDLNVFTGNVLSGITIFADNGSREGIFEFGQGGDTLIPLSDLNPDIQVSGRGTGTDPFVYSVPVILSATMPAPFDNFGSTAGSDYYVAIRPSENIELGDAFRVEMRTDQIRATAKINPAQESTNRLTANVTTVIEELVTLGIGSEIVNGENALLTSAVAIFGLDINDALGGEEKLKELKLRFQRGSVGSFTINDVADITSGPESGVALYINSGTRSGDVLEQFNPSDGLDNDGDGRVDEEKPDGIDNDGDGLIDEDIGEDKIVPFVGGFSGSTARLTFNAEGGVDIPDDNVLVDRNNNGVINLGIDLNDNGVIDPEEEIQEDNRGVDFFVVVRTSDNITHENEENVEFGDRFFAEIPIEDGIVFSSGSVRKTQVSEELTPLLNFAPEAFNIISPVEQNEPAIQDQFRIQFQYLDIDGGVEDGAVETAFFILRNATDSIFDENNAAIIPGSTAEFSAVDQLTSEDVIINSTNVGDQVGLIPLAKAKFGEEIEEVFIGGWLWDGINQPLIRTSTGSFNVSGVSKSAPPVVSVNIDDIDLPGQNVTITYSLFDPDSAPVGNLYLAPALTSTLTLEDLFPEGSTAPAGEYASRVRELDLNVMVNEGVQFTNTRSFPDQISQLPQGRYMAYMVGSDEDTINIAVSDGIVDIPQRRWPRKALDRVVTSPLVADLYNGEVEGDLEVAIVTASGQVVIYSTDGGTVAGGRYQLGQNTTRGLPVAESSPALADLEEGDDNKRNMYVAISEFNLDGEPVSTVYHLPVYQSGEAIRPGEIQTYELESVDNIQFNSIVSTPAVANIDSDPSLELVIGTGQGDLVALNLSPTMTEQWRLQEFGSIQSSPAVGDVDDDGAMEIIVYTDAGYLYVLESPDEPGVAPAIEEPTNVLELATAPNVFAVAAFSPSLGDVDDDGVSEIVIGTPSRSNIPGRVYILNGDLTSAVQGVSDPGQAPITAAGQITTAPALADVNDDGVADVVFVSSKGDYRGEIRAYSVVNGELVNLFTFELSEPPSMSPVVGDFNPGKNIFFGLSTGLLESVYWNGGEVVRTPYDVDGSGTLETIWDYPALGTEIKAPAVVADLNQNGLNEVIYISNGPDLDTGTFVGLVNTLESSVAVSGEDKPDWPTFKHDNARTGDVQAVLGIARLADVFRDGKHDFKDLFLLSTQWLKQESNKTDGASEINDLTEDQLFNADDMVIFLKYWHGKSK